MTYTNYDLTVSAIGNGLFSGIPLTDLWVSMSLSENAEQFDAGVSALIRLKEITDEHKQTS